MNLQRNPELADRLAASYALGTLRGGARRRFEAMARQSPSLRSAAVLWHERLSSMTELQQPEQPSPNVWKRIENLVAGEGLAATARTVSNSWRKRLRLWQAVSLAGAAATVAAVAVGVNLNSEKTSLAQQLASAPQVRYVAVLSDEKSTASILVTVDPRQNQMTIKRVGAFQEGPDKSLQLWALPPEGGPKSLGVLGNGAVVKLTASENEIRVPALAVSLEPKGGVPGDKGPTGPVLFKGQLLPTS